MTRNIKAQSIVLKAHPVGENHRGLVMLVRDEGLLRPLAFGAQGRRSTLRASAVPYNRGTANLHFDGARNRWRLTAFDAEDTHDGLRENLDRFYAASTWAEILLASHGGGGESAALFDLMSSALALGARVEGGRLSLLRAAFLWFFLFLEGVSPELNRCGVCGRQVHGRLYLRSGGLLCCGDCRRAEPQGAVPWSAGARGAEYPGAAFRGAVSWSAGAREAEYPGAAAARDAVSPSRKSHNITSGEIPETGWQWLSAIAGGRSFSGMLTEDMLQSTLLTSEIRPLEDWLLNLVQNFLERPLKSWRI